MKTIEEFLKQNITPKNKEYNGIFVAQGEIVVAESDALDKLITKINAAATEYPADIYGSASVDADDFIKEVKGNEFQEFLNDPQEDFFEFDNRIKVVWKGLDGDDDYDELFISFEKNAAESILKEEVIDEKYSEEDIDNLIGKVFNIQKIDNIYRRKKYEDKKLFAHTICTKCGREKTVFLSNLINDPDKYGSCICSDTNIEAKIDNIQKLFSGRKKLSSNTSGYTGVSFVKKYKGEPYNKWRAYIEVDGVRTYLGDFTSKAKAIKARKEAGEKGIKWYKDNRNRIMRDVRRRSKKFKTSKYRETQKTRRYAKVK